MDATTTNAAACGTFWQDYTKWRTCWLRNSACSNKLKQISWWQFSILSPLLWINSSFVWFVGLLLEVPELHLPAPHRTPHTFGWSWASVTPINVSSLTKWSCFYGIVLRLCCESFLLSALPGASGQVVSDFSQSSQCRLELSEGTWKKNKSVKWDVATAG